MGGGRVGGRRAPVGSVGSGGEGQREKSEGTRFSKMAERNYEAELSRLLLMQTRF